jgi:cytidyltransferase-like protein
MPRIAQRYSNYFLARDRHHPSDDLPWIRIADIGRAIHLPHPVVMVNGAFDILHVGHMRNIWTARRLAKDGGTVIAAVDSDARVARKGPGRPVLSFIERATALGYMPIDYIVEIEKDADMARLIARAQPDLRVQGMEYRNVPSKFPQIRKCFVRGARIHTSEIIRRCQLVTP